MNKSKTLLLSLTFLFLFSGTSFGGVFDKTDENVVLRCSHERSGKIEYYSVNMKDKVIKDHVMFGTSSTYKITKEDEVYIRGYLEKDMISITITKHEYDNHILLKHFAIDKNNHRKTYKENYECVVGVKKF